MSCDHDVIHIQAGIVIVGHAISISGFFPLSGYKNKKQSNYEEAKLSNFNIWNVPLIPRVDPRFPGV